MFRADHATGEISRSAIQATPADFVCAKLWSGRESKSIIVVTLDELGMVAISNEPLPHGKYVTVQLIFKDTRFAVICKVENKQGAAKRLNHLSFHGLMPPQTKRLKSN